MTEFQTPDSVAIVSGGLDSVTLLYWLVKAQARQPLVLTFTYGQKHHKEVAFARWHAEALECRHFLLDITPLSAIFASSALVGDQPIPDAVAVAGDPQPPTYVPNRNMIFLSLAAALAETAGVSDIFYGAQRHDLYGYWDTTPDFLAAINNVLALNRKQPITVHAPFVNDSKADIVRRGLALGVDYARTWSCYAGGERPCGQCPTCAERLAAFAELGLTDPGMGE